MKRNSTRVVRLLFALVLMATAAASGRIETAFAALLASDPGVRAGKAVGGPIAKLSPAERQLFEAGRVEFSEVEIVGDGLGPRMSLDNCAGCHAQPAIGGSSPALNPQVAFMMQNRGGNTLPPFISADGPVRVA